MVGYGNEGYKNVIKDEWLEFFPEPRDIRGLTMAIEKLYLKPEIRNSMVDWGKKEVQKYDWKKISEEVLQVYERVLK